MALDEAKIRDLQLSSGGLVLGQKLEDYVNAQVRNRPIEQLSKPFAAVATRLEDGERTVFTRGNTGQAVRASSSILACSSPWRSANTTSWTAAWSVRCRWTRRARRGPTSWSPWTSQQGPRPGAAGMLGTLGQSIAIMGQKLGQAELARADVVVRPQVLDIGAADFTQRASAILEGEKAALAAMPQIRERVAQLQAARAEATRLAQQKAIEAQHQACLEQRSRLQKLAGLAGLDGSCPAAAP